MNRVQYPTIQGILDTKPPSHLFHYTSPAGLIGIAQTKKLWATNTRFLNDLREMEHAVDYVRVAIGTRLNSQMLKDAYLEPERRLLQEMSQRAGSLAAEVFVASLTEMRDQLSQWRAYCPPAGGYAIGIPSRQLMAMAVAQGYYLTPCVYDQERQAAIAGELVDQHVSQYRHQIITGEDPAQARQSIVYKFAQDVSRYGPIMKHRSFHEEREWRIVSPPYWIGDPRITYRAGKNTVIPYCEFSLINPQHPNLVILGDYENSLGVVVGPTPDTTAAQHAVISILRARIGQGCWHGPSDAPYRGA